MHEHVFVPASILHADLDAFFASVEQRDNPELRGKPVAVGGGVVMAASYEARAYGVRSAMGGREARRLCPHLIVVNGRWDAYREASYAVRDVFDATGARVSPVSVDEAFLDARDLDVPARAVAEGIRRAVRERVGLPITVGVARTRLLAKMAGNAAKPDGLKVVDPEDEDAFWLPLGLEQIWGLGPSSARKLHARGLRTIRDLTELGEPELVAILGKGPGRAVHYLVANRATRPRSPTRRGRVSFGAQSALGRPRRAPEELDAALSRVTERVTSRMNKRARVGRTVVLRLRFGDYSRATRSCTLPHATAEAPTVLAALRDLLSDAMPDVRRQGLTLVGVTVTNLDDEPDASQLTFGL
ncbi:MAG: polymerase [Solirubrobacteraceae bacterium]|nr:polymerase [Solirubrobacteraceae bacterium]